MKKIFGLCVGIAALSAVLALGSPMSAFTEMIYADEVNMEDFVIDENGVLIKYKGNAEKVVVPEGVTSIGNGAFSVCTGLTSIELPEGITSIGNSAFSDCIRLTSIELPEGITSIGNSAFFHCIRLTSIELPEGIIGIGDSAFSDCENLTSIELPEGITSIGDSAFSGCTGLTSIELPEGITSIGNSAFFHCIRLTSIELPEGITSIGNGAFSGCTGLTSIELPEGITSIGNGAFSNCKNLTSIELPEGITSIGNGPFSGCTKLMSINISPENNVYVSYDGCLYNEDFTILIACPSGKSRVELLEGISSIRDDAFSGCENLTSIELPKGVTSIGDGAFSGCENLTSIELPKGVTSIGKKAFLMCDNLTIYGVENSYAHIYALENNIPFKSISNLDSSEYVVDIVANNVISASDFGTILNENKTKDIVIKANNDVTFTFAKDTMNAVHGKDSYNFGTVINKIYNSDLPFYVTKDNFVLQIIYNYSGELPAEASIRFLAGTKYTGQTLYYSLLKEDNTFAEVQKVLVDNDGYVTVKQNHCSSYLLTSEEPKIQENDNGNKTPADVTINSPESANNSEITNSSESMGNSVSKEDSPKTGDTAMLLFYLIICIATASVICIPKKYNVSDNSK